MSSNSTTWTSDANSKSGGSSSVLVDSAEIFHNNKLTIGVNDTGHDVKFYGATSGKYMEWDESADQLDITGSLDVTGNTSMVGTLTVGVDDTGHDVKFFGATSGSYMLWDESTDNLILIGGKIGIGVSNPQAKLHVSSDANGSGFSGAAHIRLSNEDTSIEDNDVLGVLEFTAIAESGGSDSLLPGAAIWAEAEGTFTAGGNQTALVFATATTETAVDSGQERMRITNTGKVGIGSTSPQGKLHVGGSESNTSSDTDNLFLSEGTGLEFMGSSSNSGYGFKIEIDDLNDGVGGHSLGFHKRIDSASWTATPVLSVNASAAGNSNRIGVNTATPSYTLEVAGAIDEYPVVAITNSSTTAADDGGELQFIREDPSANLGTDDLSLGDIKFRGKDDAGTAITGALIRGFVDGSDAATNDLPAGLKFMTNAGGTTVATRMTIDKNGKVGIGTASPAEMLNVEQANGSDNAWVARFDNKDADNPQGIVIHHSAVDLSGDDTSDHQYIGCNDSNNNVMTVYGDGDIINEDNSYTSDIRIKTNVVDATSKLDELLKLKVRNYHYKGSDGNAVGSKRLGFVADELEAVFPSLIKKRKINKFGVEYDDLKTITASVLVPILVKAVQELSAKVTALENA